MSVEETVESRLQERLVDYDDGSAEYSEWRNYDVEPWKELPEMTSESLANLRGLLEPGVEESGSDYASICNALVAMGEDLGTDPVEGTGVAGEPGELVFFEDGEFKAKRNSLKAKDFKPAVENSRISRFATFFTPVDKRGKSVTGEGLAVMDRVPGFPVGKVYGEEHENTHASQYSIEITGEDLKSLYLAAKETGKWGEDSEAKVL